MLNVIKWLNFFIAVLFTVAYAYQFAFLMVGLVSKKRRVMPEPQKMHKYAAIISARNEETVIADLIQSLKEQNYPEELLHVYVLADNCTDNTALVARQAGARVFERFNKSEVGKGYALNYLFSQLHRYYAEEQYEGYFVFDADNLLDPNFVMEMNKVYDQGYEVITSYRNSKNFAANWISAGYSIWFLREARFLNFPRMLLGTNCAISGTGFLVSDRLIQENHGWPYHLLTEDIEFTTNCAIQNHRIGYCDRAVIYDEQPTSFAQSWTQRMRWSKGFYQVNANYSITLFKTIFRGGRHGASCYDMFMTVAPGMLLTLLAIIFNVVVGIICLTQPAHMKYLILAEIGQFLISTLCKFYLGLFLYGVITVVTEWKQIHARWYEKLAYLGCFPLFMFTYVPISLAALIQKVEWAPIRHSAMSEVHKA